MVDAIKVAVIGTNIGCTLHVRALRAAGFEVTALVGRNAEVTAQRAAHFGIANAWTSTDMLLDNDVDAIVVATPPLTHHDLVMRSIAAGKHVMCEKPFALDVAKAREMRDAAIEAGIAHMVTHEFRWYAQNASMRHVVRSGMLGDPIQVVAEFDHHLCAPARIDVPDWWKNHADGGGWLRNYNAHGIDLIRYMVGDFAAVCGSTHAGADRGMSSDDSYAAAFVLQNGAQGVMAGSARSQDYYASTRIIGSDGTAMIGMNGLSVIDGSGSHGIELPADIAESLRGGGPAVSAPTEALPRMEDSLYVQTHSSDYGFAEMVGLYAGFGSWIRDRDYRNAAIADFNDGLAHVEVIDAIERSRAERRWIDLV